MGPTVQRKVQPPPWPLRPFVPARVSGPCIRPTSFPAPLLHSQAGGAQGTESSCAHTIPPTASQAPAGSPLKPQSTMTRELTPAEHVPASPQHDASPPQTQTPRQVRGARGLTWPWQVQPAFLRRGARWGSSWDCLGVDGGWGQVSARKASGSQRQKEDSADLKGKERKLLDAFDTDLRFRHRTQNSCSRTREARSASEAPSGGAGGLHLLPHHPDSASVSASPKHQLIPTTEVYNGAPKPSLLSLPRHGAFHPSPRDGRERIISRVNELPPPVLKPLCRSQPHSRCPSCRMSPDSSRNNSGFIILASGGSLGQFHWSCAYLSLFFNTSGF